MSNITPTPEARCDHKFVPVFNALYSDGGRYHGVESTKQTACSICGESGPDNPKQQIFTVEPSDA
jgi:hypothetical protein